MNGRCTATVSSTGERCKKAPIAGGTVCRFHGGATRHVAAKAAVRAEVERWGLSGKTSTDDPGEILLRLVTTLRVKVEHLGDEIQRKIDEGRELYGDEFALERILIGDTMAVGEYGAATKTGEYIRGLVKLEADAQNDLANAASKAVAAGLGERMVRQAERDGEMLAVMLFGIADRLQLTPEQRALVPMALREAGSRDEASS